MWFVDLERRREWRFQGWEEFSLSFVLIYHVEYGKERLAVTPDFRRMTHAWWRRRNPFVLQSQPKNIEEPSSQSRGRCLNFRIRMNAPKDGEFVPIEASADRIACWKAD